MFLLVACNRSRTSKNIISYRRNCDIVFTFPAVTIGSDPMLSICTGSASSGTLTGFLDWEAGVGEQEGGGHFAQANV